MKQTKAPALKRTATARVWVGGAALAWGLLGSLFSTLVCAAEPASSAPAPSTTNPAGLNVLIIGHSLTHCLWAMESLSLKAGHPGQKQSLYTILGAGIAYHYKADTNRGAKKSWRELYFPPGKKWDVLIMSARDADYRGAAFTSSDEVYAPKFAAEAFQSNPQCQIFIYGNWADASTDVEKPPYGNSEAHVEKVAAAVDQAFPAAPKTRVIPSGLLVRELERMADRGELPGVPSRFALFSDSIHPNRFTSYAINTLVCAMLYNESPLAYPADICPVDGKGQPVHTDVHRNVFVPDETAAVIKRVVWDILQTYPPALMPPKLVIANRRLDPVIAGQPYQVELKALNAAGPCTWTITQGSLPPGLSLSGQGVLSGKSTAAGDYPLTLQLTDGKSSFERPLVLSVTPDTPPTIPAQALPKVSLDRYLLHPLKVEGGVGHITWRLSDGQLPHGLMLTPGGILVGTPGEAGEFSFKIQADDSFPGGPRTAEKSFNWTITPALPETLLVKCVMLKDSKDTKTVTMDGKLDEAFWKLDQPIEKKVQGNPAKKASFGLVWSARRENKNLVGQDLYVAVKVLDGPQGKTAKDGVHIFLDGNHNRSVIYSGDDTHFFIPRDHKGGWAQSLRGKVNWFSDARVQEIEGGYTVEIRLGGGNYLAGEGNWLRFGAKGVYGFDIAVDEGNDKEISQQVWRGDARDAEDTSHFGTIVLVNDPAMPSAATKPDEK